MSRQANDLDKIGKRVTQLFKNQSSARIVGKAYLAVFPEEEILDYLVSKLALEEHPVSPNFLDRCLNPQHHAIRSRIRRDFDTGDCVQIHGWMLSRTEARLCALSTFV
jgi:hypothetical protein